MEKIEETVADFIPFGSKITADGDLSHEIKRCLLLGRKAMTNLDSILENGDITLLTKACLVKGMVFSSGHVWMWELDIKKAWRQGIDSFELWCWRSPLWSSLDSKEIKPVNPEGTQTGIVIGRTDVKVEVPILWPFAVKSWLIGNDPVAAKDWRKEEMGVTEGEMFGWHHWLNGHLVWVSSRSWW